ncbi:MAG: hypothetical protein HRT47_08940 [Candidatus Caenarcaniphilales bacterium]|nr:hypothetical protein [Candidatus Caenarcaniphilales bacterium]
MIAVDFTLVLFLFSFIVFLFLLDLFFFKPVASSLEARESGIDQQKGDLDSIHSDIAKKIEHLEADTTLIEAKQKANSIVAQARNEANKEKQDLVAKSSNDMSIRVEEMVNAIEDDTDEIFKSADKFISNLTNSIQSRLLGMIESRSQKIKDDKHSLV